MKTGEDGMQKLAEVLAPYRMTRSAQPSAKPSDGSQRTGTPNILQSLLAVQKALRYVPSAAIPEIAGALEVTEADVAGVLSYYPELRTSQPGRHLIRVCTGESCVANHCGKLLASLQDRLKVRGGETTADGRFTLQHIYCVGNCAVGPSLMIDEDVYGRVAAEDVARLIEPYQ